MRAGKAQLIPGLVPLIYAIQILACAVGAKNARFNWIFFALLAGICIYHIFLTTSDDAARDYVSATSASSLFFYASDYILLRNHQTELRRIGQKKATSDMSLLERLKWSFNLSMTPRLLGWSTEPTSHIRPRPQSTRALFIATQLAWIFVYVLMFDISAIIARTIPIYAKGGPPYSEYGVAWRATIWVYIFYIYAMLSMTYTGASVITVTLGLYQPQDWPHIFGYPQDSFSVRNVWGKVWHQMLRKPVTAHANVLANMLGLPKSRLTTYLKLYVAFFISGLIHYAGDYILHQDWAGRSVTFFVLQAVAITFEDGLIALAKRVGFKASPLSKLVGFCWVFIWFSFSIPFWLERNFHAGTLDDGPNKSFILGVWKGEWTQTRI